MDVDTLAEGVFVSCNIMHRCYLEFFASCVQLSGLFSFELFTCYMLFFGFHRITDFLTLNLSMT